MLWGGVKNNDLSLLRPYKDILPLKVKARILSWKWKTVSSSVYVRAMGDVFYKVNGVWSAGFAGDVVRGVIKWR